MIFLQISLLALIIVFYCIHLDKNQILTVLPYIIVAVYSLSTFLISEEQILLEALVSFVLGLIFGLILCNAQKLRLFSLAYKINSLPIFTNFESSDTFGKSLLLTALVLSFAKLAILGISTSFSSADLETESLLAKVFKRLIDGLSPMLVFYAIIRITKVPFNLELKTNNRLLESVLAILAIILAGISSDSKSTLFAFSYVLIAIISLSVAKMYPKLKKGKISAFQTMVICLTFGMLIVSGNMLNNFIIDRFGISLLDLAQYRLYNESKTAIDEFVKLADAKIFPFSDYSDIPLNLIPIVSPLLSFFENLSYPESLGQLVSCKGSLECIQTYKNEVLLPVWYWGYFDFGYVGSFILGLIFSCATAFCGIASSTGERNKSFNLGIYIFYLVLLSRIVTALGSGKLIWVITQGTFNLLVLLIVINLFSLIVFSKKT